MTPVDVAVAMMTAYREQDATSALALLDETFVFTSPQDDHIDRTAFMANCFPTAPRFARQELLAAEETAAGVFLLYEYELESGECYRNAEVLTVRDGRITETQVFFGSRY